MAPACRVGAGGRRGAPRSQSGAHARPARGRARRDGGCARSAVPACGVIEPSSPHVRGTRTTSGGNGTTGRLAPWATKPGSGQAAARTTTSAAHAPGQPQAASTCQRNGASPSTWSPRNLQCSTFALGARPGAVLAITQAPAQANGSTIPTAVRHASATRGRLRARAPTVSGSRRSPSWEASVASPPRTPRTYPPRRARSRRERGRGERKHHRGRHVGHPLQAVAESRSARRAGRVPPRSRRSHPRAPRPRARGAPVPRTPRRARTEGPGRAARSRPRARRASATAALGSPRGGALRAERAPPRRSPRRPRPAHGHAAIGSRSAAIGIARHARIAPLAIASIASGRRSNPRPWSIA